VTPAEAIAHSTIETDELRLRQVRLLSRFTPINVLTALAAAWLVAAVSWPFVPSTLLGGWLAVQTVLSVGAIYRWWRLWQRRRSGDRPIRSRTYGRAVVWAAFGGVVWGAVVLFMPYLPPAACVTVSMVLVSLAVGASITYAPVAPAAGAFVVTALAPSAVYALFEGNSEQIWVGLVGLLGIVVFTSIAKVVQRGFQEEIRARIAVRTSEQALERERSEWLDATNISAAIALFDEADRLLRWNQPYETLLGPGPWLERGARRSEMFLHWSNGNRSAVEQALFPDSSRPAGDGPFVEHQLASGRWIRSSARILPNGRLVEVHQDVTAERSLGELLNASAEWGRLLVRIALAANEAGARASDILGPVCRLTGWKAALAWQRRPAGSGYTLAGRWPDERGADDGQADPSLRLGLDDRASRRLLSDGVQVFSHVASAAEMGGPQPAAGVRSGVLVAVPIGDQLAGLLEFLDAGNVSLTGNMSSVLSQIGVQVGRL
jgi:PAS domain-containing protein